LNTAEILRSLHPRTTKDEGAKPKALRGAKTTRIAARGNPTSSGVDQNPPESDNMNKDQARDSKTDDPGISLPGIKQQTSNTPAKPTVSSSDRKGKENDQDKIQTSSLRGSQMALCVSHALLFRVNHR
jgi:hypothetical protein